MENINDNNKEKQLKVKQEIETNSSLIEEITIKQTDDIQIRKYYKVRLLGEGNHSKCYEFKCYENNKLFAAKVYNKKNLEKQKFMNEINIHKSLYHSNIVAFNNYFADKENIYILLELCQNQTLNELLKRRKTLTEIEVQCYLIQLIKALKYLHSRDIIHCNLKLQHLFLTDKMELKLGGFGSAINAFDKERKKVFYDSSNYIPPEILNNKEEYSYEVDIWSSGVILYTLLIGNNPFEAKDIETTFKKIKINGYIFPKMAIISEEAKDLISKILVLDSSKRPSLDQILSHDYFKQNNTIPELMI